MASRKVKKPKKRAQRATSNVFAMFAQDQIQVKYHMLSLKYANSNFIFLYFYIIVRIRAGILSLIQSSFSQISPPARI